MIDINIIRNSPKIVRKNLERRKDNEKLLWIDDLIKKDEEARTLQQKLDKLRQKRNKATEEINELKKEGKNLKDKIQEIQELPKKIKQTEDKLNELKIKIKFYMMQLPNIMHESVPYGKDDTQNKEIRKWGKPKESSNLINHGELIEKLNLGDFKRAAKISGKGFYFLKNDLALLNRALISFAIDFMTEKGYEFIDSPLMINKKVIDSVTDTEFFKEMIYNIEGEDLNLIATSEHPLMGMYANETLENLPIKMVGYSQCFRKEIGSHGVDERGLFRVHQFHKVEQVILCKPEESWKLMEELIKNSEDIFKKLKLPHRVVNICTGDLGIVASKKYDLEVWLPRQKKYREACSCSNCTDYQTRRLNIKFGMPGAPKNELAHSLNNTAIATSRVLIAILENYQNKDGTINVPDVLQPYMKGKKVIGK